MTGKNLDLLREVVKKCEEKGINLTSKRKKVLIVLQDHDVPLSAYEIADVLKQSLGESLPIMSIYRMLDFLVQEQLVHKLLTVNKYIACYHVCDHHIHNQFLICNTCQKVTEIALPTALVEQLQLNVSQAEFTLSSPQLELAGWCHECRQQHNS
ncbi:Fur family transcriptional regulator [Shewanella oncorhynchi]|uniref:Fur family transcriptional regulator n=1 Tax=Shewanella oncorhynchi TaxID=2726434 RepID=UPI003D7A7541